MMMMTVGVAMAVAVAETSLLDSFDVPHEESQCLDYLRPGLQGQGLYQEHESLGSV